MSTCQTLRRLIYNWRARRRKVGPLWHSARPWNKQYSTCFATVCDFLKSRKETPKIWCISIVLRYLYRWRKLLVVSYYLYRQHSFPSHESTLNLIYLRTRNRKTRTFEAKLRWCSICVRQTQVKYLNDLINSHLHNSNLGWWFFSTFILICVLCQNCVHPNVLPLPSNMNSSEACIYPWPQGKEFQSLPVKYCRPFHF